MKTVLLLDDARSIRTLFAQLVEKAGHTAVTAENPSEALSLIADGLKPDLILTDINMPGMNGIEFAREVRSKLIGVPILVMSTESDKRLIMEAREAGVTGWLLKPVDHDTFMNKLRMLLGEGLAV